MSGYAAENLSSAWPRGYRRVVIIIDESDGILKAVFSDFLYTLREIYQAREPKRCPLEIRKIHERIQSWKTWGIYQGWLLPL